MAVKISKAMIDAFIEFKREGWSNELAARKAGMMPKQVYELMDQEPHIGEFCATLMKPAQRVQAEKVYLRRIRKKGQVQ